MKNRQTLVNAHEDMTRECARLSDAVYDAKTNEEKETARAALEVAREKRADALAAVRVSSPSYDRGYA